MSSKLLRLLASRNSGYILAVETKLRKRHPAALARKQRPRTSRKDLGISLSARRGT